MFNGGGSNENAINLAGLEHVIICTAANEKIYWRVYRIALKKSGSKVCKNKWLLVYLYLFIQDSKS